MLQQRKQLLRVLGIGLVLLLLAFSFHEALEADHECGPHCAVCARLAAVRHLLLGLGTILLTVCLYFLTPWGLFCPTGAPRALSRSLVARKVRFSE